MDPVSVRRAQRGLGLCRLKPYPRRNSVLIPLRSVIRGALIYENRSLPDDFYAVDTVDTDMFLRCRTLFPYR